VNTKPHIETRISNRAKSIFAAFGTIINDFYLEAGIYFVGGFNAALVAWDIYTTLVINGQPLLYAIILATIAFIAVEGLAVFLVGAAAKTNNGLLWFFSVVFAAFFTYAHYQEMTVRAGIIAQYITLAIPPFVVVGYWARTVKIDVENEQAQRVQQLENEAARLRQIEDEERQRQREIEDQVTLKRNNEAARQRQIEDEERQYQREIKTKQLAHNLEMDRIKSEQEQAQKMAQIEVQNLVQSPQTNQMNRQNGPLEPANGARKNKKVNRRNDLIDLVRIEPDLGPTELTRRLNEIGHSVSISTVKRDIKQLNGKAKT
jgi:flagellar biosynthesis GTPase FlhF